MDIAVIGTGYVGLTTGACFAELGHDVACIDKDRAKIADLKGGRLPIYEQGLEELVSRNAALGRLSFVEDMAAGLGNADLVFLAVGTPSTVDGDVDLGFVEDAAREAAPHLRHDSVLVIKSTVPAGTAAHIRRVVLRASGATSRSVASNPEFLREGTAISDFFNPDRIVVGADDARAAGRLRQIYAPFASRGIPLLVTTTANAELIKYAANAFLALKIGFVNDVSDLCEQTGGDITDVAEGVGLDRRIGKAFLSPGPGFGGSCFPKDTRAFVATGRRHGVRQSLVETLVKANERRKLELAERVVKGLGRAPAGAVVAVLGTSFKAGTDDMREAAALTVIPFLRGKGIAVRAHDPRCRPKGEALLPDIRWDDDPYAAAEGADAVVILTEWDDYRTLDCRRLAGVMRGRALFDYRNLFDPETVAAHGLHYSCLGRPMPAAPRNRPVRWDAAGGEWRDIAAAPY